MLYFLAGLLLILSGLTFTVASPIFDVTTSEAWLSCVLGFGLIAASLPIFKQRRSLRDAMVAVALFALYTAGMIAVRDGLRGRPQHQVTSYAEAR